jgi:3'-phosphoadenosine 5'-phosphosulfate sulfotransferase (PAPS reductase)/FAD synthetase
MNGHRINHLEELENESIYVMREVAAQFENPALLFSGGKDSIVMVHLARKAFWPQRFPSPCSILILDIISMKHSNTGINWSKNLGPAGRRLVQESIRQRPCCRRIRL